MLSMFSALVREQENVGLGYGLRYLGCVNKDCFFGFLTFKYRTDKRILGDILGTIIGLG